MAVRMCCAHLSDTFIIIVIIILLIIIGSVIGKMHFIGTVKITASLSLIMLFCSL